MGCDDPAPEVPVSRAGNVFRPCRAIIECIGTYLNINGKTNKKGIIRDAKDAQRMMNYWRTLETELIALAPKAPYIGPKGAFESDMAKWGKVIKEAGIRAD